MARGSRREYPSDGKRGGFSYLNSTPGEPRPLQGQEGGGNAKAELSPRAEEVVGGLATELFKSRPGFPRPPLLDSLATVETKEISFRRPARGECSKGGEARDSSRSAFNWWLFLRGGN